MNILAIDTSGPTCGVAILADGAVRFSQTVLNKRTHSVNLMPMVDAAFTFTVLTLADMDRLACVVGPGSFTGVRLGAGARQREALRGGERPGGHGARRRAV